MLKKHHICELRFNIVRLREWSFLRDWGSFQSNMSLRFLEFYPCLPAAWGCQLRKFLGWRYVPQQCSLGNYWQLKVLSQVILLFSPLHMKPAPIVVDSALQCTSTKFQRKNRFSAFLALPRFILLFLVSQYWISIRTLLIRSSHLPILPCRWKANT